MKQTRAQLAKELQRLCANGPESCWMFCHDLPEKKMRTDAENYATESYRLWSQTWVLPLIENLLARDLH